MGKKKQPAASGQSRSGPGDKIRLSGNLRVSPPSSSAPPRRSGPDSARSDVSGKPDAVKDTAEYYRLKTKAVDDLVTANEENSPPVSRAELRKYHAGPKIRLADWVKAILLKWWIGGMICYFFIWGLSTISMNQWDHLLILGIALGLCTNLITNNIFRFVAKVPGAYDRWMMFPGKSLLFLPADLLYASLLIVCTVMTYHGINHLLAGGQESASAALGVEPLLFGAVLTLWDLLFLGCKRLCRQVLSDAMHKVSEGNGRPADASAKRKTP